LVTAAKGGSVFDSIRWSPDGESISYIKDEDLWVMNVNSKKTKKVISKKLVFHSAWLDSSRLIVYTDNEDKQVSLKGNLAIVDHQSGKLEDIISDVESVQTFSIKGSNVFLGEDKYGIRSLSLSDFQIRDEFLMENGTNFKLSPEGNQFAFMDWENEQDDKGNSYPVLSIYNFDEVYSVDKLKDYRIYNYCWSSDGQFIAFTGQTSSDKTTNLYLFNLKRNSDPIIVQQSINAADLDWSPIGNQLVIEKLGQPGQNDIRVIDVPSKLLQ